jgi:hypothetical protein
VILKINCASKAERPKSPCERHGVTGRLGAAVQCFAEHDFEASTMTPIFETFAHRKRLATREGEPDVYTYDSAPHHLRHQICMALCEGIGQFMLPEDLEWNHAPNANDIWEEMDKICRKEIHSYLKYVGERDLRSRFCSYIMQIGDMDDFLSAVEIGCVALSVLKDEYGGTEARGAEQPADRALEEINQRFLQHAVGYQFENRHLIRVDSKLAHAELIKPALQLLTWPLFGKANEEFMLAHKHYRAGVYKDCVTAANRAFESMLKAICDAEKWTYEKGFRAPELVTLVTNNGLFTHDFDRSFASYVAMMKSGLPSVRNDAGGHGEGIAAAAVSVQIARFALNLTASNILFLGESYNALKARAPSDHQ